LAYYYNETCNGCIPFQNELLNIGGAIDLGTGYFTAPVTGTYHFEFYGIGEEALYFYYYRTGGGSYIAAPYIARQGVTTGYTGTVGFTASLRLQKGEQMRFQMEANRFSSGIEGPVHFYTGWLVEEELEWL